jgi:hypothetical protein
MGQDILLERAAVWVRRILASFGWEVDRQAAGDPRFVNTNNPTASFPEWECGRARGILILDDARGMLGWRIATEPTDPNESEVTVFEVDIRVTDARAAEIRFVPEGEPERALTTAEVASLFLDRLRDADVR